jgi:hypothetical protein
MAKLSQALVTRYGKYQALKNLLDAWLETQREKILPALLGGAGCPGAGPFLLELAKILDRVNWKEEFSRHLRRQGFKKTAVAKLFATIEARPRKKSPRVLVKRNANYRRKFPIRLPS